MFQAGAGAYRGKTPSEAFVLLVERVEEEISKERSQTIQMRTARTSEADQQRGQSRQEGAPTGGKNAPAAPAGDT